MSLKNTKLILSLFFSLLLFTQCSTDLLLEDTFEEEQVASSRSKEKYIIILQDDLDLEDLEGLKGIGKGILNQIKSNDDPEQFYFNSIKGFTANLSPGLLNKISKLPEVALVIKDEVMSLAPPPGKGWNKDNNDDSNDPPSQITPWGIQRVNGGINATAKRAWILDTGIDLNHPDLNIDRSMEFSAFRRGRDSGTDDKNGHGTHVAGTIGALNNDFGVIGVAAGAKVVPVKVLDGDGSGSWSGILDGIEHVATYGSPGEVANLSLGGGANSTLDQAIINAAAYSGVTFVIAAGNSAANTANYSPARVNGPNIYTISAMDRNDNFASFSNYGSAVDYCLPGVSILSTWNDGAYHSISGTSMATPHAAGLFLLNSSKTDGTVKNDPDGNPDLILVY